MQIQANRQSSKRPDIVAEGAHWRADLRGLGFGRYRVGLRAEIDESEATHRAYELLSKLRRQGMADIGQQELAIGAPDLFAGALDRCEAERIFDSDGGRAWFHEHAGLVRRELAGYRLADFAPPAGNARLSEYVRQLAARALSGRTIRNRLSIVEQALRFAVERGWLAGAPLHPRMPAKAAPVFRWLSEPMFRQLRARIYVGRDGSKLELRGFRPAEPPAIYVARRRAYLSWLFYTGVHKRDADDASADHLFVDGREYIRVNTKSARCVGREHFEMPEPLHADLLELQAALGRPFFPGEPFTGGPWRNVVPVMQRAAVRCGFPHGANPAILRRSYAREMLQRGYSVREVADRMGHTDERMLKEIYTRFPRPAGRPRTRWTLDAAQPVAPAPAGLARVLRIGGAP